jgi:Spy/CpxP family protein refolding chaperone
MMNKLINRRLTAAAPFLVSLLLLCYPASPARAQEHGAAVPGEAERTLGTQGGELGRVLGLTPEQVAKIRLIRQQHQEERRLAGERLRRAQRALDEAIYADDNASENVIEERSREVAQALSATIRLRALTELNIRRVLTPEQIGILRTLRLRQGQQRRMERQLNRRRQIPDRRPGGNTGGVPPLQRDRFRQRENAPLQQTDGNRPPALPRDRRPEPPRKSAP